MSGIQRFFATSSVLLFLSCMAHAAPSESTLNNHQKNLLIISLCSARASFLPIFGEGNAADFPNFTRIFNKSILFTNAHATRTWSNILNYFKVDPNGKNLRKKKYSHILDHKNFSVDETTLYEKPFTKMAGRSIFLSRKIEAELTDDKKPDIAMLHYSFMHYPYFSQEEWKNSPDFRASFTAEEAKQLSVYLAQPDSFYKKRAFMQAMFLYNFKWMSKKKLKVLYVNDSQAIADWKSSENFELDLRLLKKTYAFRMKLLDKEIGKLLDFYESNLKKNTVLVLTSDHGESFHDHGYLGHSTAPYDELTKIFASITIPESDQKVIAPAQASQPALATAIISLLGKVDPASIEKSILQAKISGANIPAASCDGKYISIRSNSKWKLMWDVANNQRQLFNLEKDPTELLDVSKKHSQITEKLGQLAEKFLFKAIKFKKDDCVIVDKQFDWTLTN